MSVLRQQLHHTGRRGTRKEFHGAHDLFCLENRLKRLSSSGSKARAGTAMARLAMQRAMIQACSLSRPASASFSASTTSAKGNPKWT